MNDRNVEALALALFQEQAQQPNAHVPAASLRGTGFWTLAERLASRGVLAPGVLTDQQAGTVWEAGSVEDYREDEFAGMVFANPDQMRAALDRIAKGKP